MPLGSYRIGSRNRYIAPPSFVKVTPAKIAPESIVSMQGLKNTEVSWSYDSVPSQPHMFVDSHGNGVAVRRTSNKLHFVPAYDLKAHGNFGAENDSTMGYAGWKAAGEKYGPSHFEYVKLPETTIHSGVVSSFREMPSYFDIRDPWISKFSSDLYISETHLNKTGKRLSEIENLRQHLTSYYGTSIARTLAQEAISSGRSLEDIGYIGAGHLPKGATYGVTRMSDGRVVVLAGYSYDAIAKAARSWGVDVKTYLETIMAEEGEHINRKSFDRFSSEDGFIAEEEVTKDSVYRAFSRLAKGAEGGDPRNPWYGKQSAKLKAQARIKLNDRNTTEERYRGLYSRDKTSLKLMLEMDAMEKGLEGEAVAEYVEGRMAQIEAEPESKPMSRLERIADEGQREKPATKEAIAEAAE
ncbi:hypothetical protein HYX08_06760 [Candidatus Woesearchaeota archaeon]|nr:hypothetical protein [Candidatus Woesearchaeota archaeon]